MAVNLFFSALPRIADVVVGMDGSLPRTVVSGAEWIATTVPNLYPFTDGFPVGTVALLVAIVLFVGVSLITQDRRTVPEDIAVLLEG